MAATIVRVADRSYESGFQPTQPQNLARAAFGLHRIDAQYGIIATPAGTQVNSFSLIGGINEILTVASANDGVKLPKADPGRLVFVINNDAAADAKLFTFEATGVTIDGTAGATGITLTHGKMYCLMNVSPTKWISMKGA